MTTRWLSYRDLAAALGIKTASARQLVKRHRWPRQIGNDGHTRIAVPEDVLASRAELTVTPGVEPRSEPGVEPTVAGDADPTLREPIATVPVRHLDWLQREIEVLRERLAAQDGLALQVAALTATVAELRAERDRWHAAAVERRSWW